MRILLFVFVFLSFSFGDILDYKTNIKKDKAVVTLLFDKPFNKDLISINVDNMNAGLITIRDSFIFKNVTKSFKNSFLKTIKFVKLDKKTYLLFSSDKDLKVDIKTDDKNMKIFINLALKKQSLPFIDSAQNDKLELKEETIGYKNYLFSFLIVVVILIMYWIFRVKVLKLPNNLNSASYRVIFQKSLDMKVKISLIGVENKKYLILTGVGHSVLLDTLEGDVSKEDFKIMVDNASSKA